MNNFITGFVVGMILATATPKLAQSFRTAFDTAVSYVQELAK